ncbi:MAG TPA: HPP family protein [Methanocella sp.]|nr:HPP family protein [Methanocella sp.]
MGSTAFLLAVYPYSQLARFYNTLIGHLAGVSSGYLVVIALGLANMPSVFETGRLQAVQILASGIGVALVILLQTAVKARHPPGAATALLITLGGFRVVWQDFLAIIIGASIMAVLGEASRRLDLALHENGR